MNGEAADKKVERLTGQPHVCRRCEHWRARDERAQAGQCVKLAYLESTTGPEFSCASFLHAEIPF